MSLPEADIAFATELFSTLPDLTCRRMFGGMALYSDGTIFALLRSDGVILLKAQANVFAAELAGYGSEKWTYTRKNGASAAMPYWTLPEAALDDPDLATTLAHRALAHLR
ncbi:DNA transformation protein [Sulfitobacter brevis]|uniref:DNA transformation protein n=1 Tax=Sulfitobacter brevis TaxID=74348 RepID=A0A1I1ZUN2_9RHOB|nr:TfoX/Sxy family protein [Sulfitobacter brevis]SFE35494.1 DNA transformation protein [Sulfitobacter brevis]